MNKDTQSASAQTPPPEGNPPDQTQQQTAQQTPPPETQAQPTEDATKAAPKFLARMRSSEPQASASADDAGKSGKPPEEKPDPEAGGKKPDEAPAPPAEKDKGKKKVIKVAKGYEPPPHAPIDTQKIAEAAARAAAEAVSKTQPQAPSATPSLELTDEEKHQIKVLKELETIMPEKYKGIAGKAEKFISEVASLESSLRQKWESENPLSEFNGEEEREAAFQTEFNRQASGIRKKMGFNYDKDDFIEARVSLRYRDKLEKVDGLVKETEAKDKQQAAEKTAKIAEAAGIAAGNDVATELLKDDAKKFIGEDGMVKVDELIEHDPETGHIVADAIDFSRKWTATITAVFNGGGNEAMQQNVLLTCLKYEQEISSLPPEQKTDESGRVFATARDFERMSESERSKHWVLSPEVVISMKKQEILDIANSAAETERKRLQAVAKKKGWSEGQKPPEKKAGDPPEAQQTARAQKPVSPSTVVTPQPTKTPDSTPSQTGGRFFSRMKSGTTAGTTL